MRRVAIVGHTGTVGRQVYRWFCERAPERGLSVTGWSLDAQGWDWCGADCVFVCVPTLDGPELARQVCERIELNLERLEVGPVVVIKSTVPPGTTHDLAQQFPRLRFLCNPEFLSAATAWLDFVRPERQIVGQDGGLEYEAETLLVMLPRAERDVRCSTTEAEVLKYTHNAFGALMVTYANMVYDICERAGADYDRVRRAAPSEWLPVRTVERYWDVWAGGYRGYGGACFPKDMRTLENWCLARDVPHELLAAMRKANARLLAGQGLSEEAVS